MYGTRGLSLFALASGIGALVSGSWNGPEGRSCNTGAFPYGEHTGVPDSALDGSTCQENWDIKYLKDENVLFVQQQQQKKT